LPLLDDLPSAKKALAQHSSQRISLFA